MSEEFVPKLLGRSDYAIISDIIEPKARVLDLGCGEGELLAWLAENKRVDARGVEIEGAKVRSAISRGVSVFEIPVSGGSPASANAGAGGPSSVVIMIEDDPGGSGGR